MLRRFLVTAFVVFPAAGIPAGEPSPFAAPTSDAVLTLQVTAALQADAALKNLPLTVDVVARVATVGGEVPDAARLAEVRTTASGVAGLAGVSIECRVAGGGESFAQRVREKLASPPTRPAEAPGPSRRVETRVTAFRTPEPARGTEAAAEALRAGDARFARLTLSFDDGLVTVSGAAATHDDVTALVAHLRKVPGVSRVRRGSIAAAG